MEQGRRGQGRADHQHSQAIQLFSITILHDLLVTFCVCLEGSALFHIIVYCIETDLKLALHHMENISISKI